MARLWKIFGKPFVGETTKLVLVTILAWRSYILSSESGKDYIVRVRRVVAANRGSVPVALKLTHVWVTEAMSQKINDYDLKEQHKASVRLDVEQRAAAARVQIQAA